MIISFSTIHVSKDVRWPIRMSASLLMFILLRERKYFENRGEIAGQFFAGLSISTSSEPFVKVSAFHWFMKE